MTTTTAILTGITVVIKILNPERYHVPDIHVNQYSYVLQNTVQKILSVQHCLTWELQPTALDDFCNAAVYQICNILISCAGMARICWKSTKCETQLFVCISHSCMKIKFQRIMYHSFRELTREQILSAGPSLTFIVIMRWSSFSNINAEPSISCCRNSSAYMLQPGRVRIKS